MILQRHSCLDRSIQLIGCEFLAVIAAVECKAEGSLTVEETNTLWSDLCLDGEISPTKGMVSTGAYRQTIGRAASMIGRPQICGDMVADMEAETISFYKWWHSTDFSFALDRRILQGGTLHSFLVDSRFQPIFNSSPGLSYGIHVSFQLLWIGPRAEWLRRV
jgi:hypothetical protein